MDLKQLNLKNKTTEANITSISIIFANTWMTLVSPILIGLFISKLFSANNVFTGSETAFAAIAIVIHIILALILYKSGSRQSNSVEIDNMIHELNTLKQEVIPKAQELFDCSTAQQIVIYLMTLELESRIREINLKDKNHPIAQRWEDWGKGLEAVLSHLVKHRAQLFRYNGNSLYNMALYMHDKTDDDLFIIWRKHDDRMVTSNRRWKPGLGHVGLAFVQQEAKICHDIFESTELANSSTSDESDKTKYRSFLSIPITDSLGNNNGGKPLGVLVFTSSSVGQFDWERDRFFTLTIAKLLSIYIERNVTDWTGASE
ncbi:GAF domain-containing protein [Pseudomonas sp. 39167]|uniref:GAF domain-containing protein n=1 Tax=Pseudomonas sp. 39167 TaxID=2967215 RepID=UPI002363D83A|nr:GAF domain-containing protein [Pseudomonas sp. 39167]MDD2032738.1 GAF domain-containing protein [Pseudomonas sp. 39167]